MPFVEIITEKGDIFQNGYFDGIIGMAYPQLANVNGTLLDYM